ncbi:hypothetical protein FIBSPDRAFT_881409 [Athelia psychrophila]|uniref:Uncharacterized protein n=1 Tax=Athelia psychrophila TaxID=1759441 RepID=A0A166WN04_9AGAM|nr:hypothetical protein FIBSPDRAFT_881409 [Fibularhizoctonia sp. CBS 109695]
MTNKKLLHYITDRSSVGLAMRPRGDERRACDWHTGGTGTRWLASALVMIAPALAHARMRLGKGAREAGGRARVAGGRARELADERVSWRTSAWGWRTSTWGCRSAQPNGRSAVQASGRERSGVQEQAVGVLYGRAVRGARASSRGTRAGGRGARAGGRGARAGGGVRVRAVRVRAVEYAGGRNPKIHKTVGGRGVDELVLRQKTSFSVKNSQS